MTASTSDPNELCRQARKLLRHGKLEEAIALFQAGLEQDERNLALQEGLATAYFMGEQYELAIKHFQRMTVLDPRIGKPWINLGAVYNRMGDHNRAVEALRKGIPKERNCAHGHYNLGLAYRGLGQQSMAISAYREAIRIDPEMAEAHQNLANAYVDMGSHQQAITHYKKALEIDPDFLRAQTGLQRAEEALESARTAFSPFGRLVDEQQTKIQDAPGSQRELSDEDRVEDRQQLFELTNEIDSAGTAVIADMKSGLLQQLHDLSRAVVQAEESPRNFARAGEQYSAAVETTESLRKTLRRSLLKLRAHEEIMNSPDFDLA
ncbi:MAG: tetratricopeptide repeat protein [Planctomycetaceae bacterium]|nr:tetratricopeptide repeat protein [Planctomycetaceae bacterium]